MAQSTFNKTPQEAYEEMLAQRAKEEQSKIVTQTESKPVEKSVAVVPAPTETPTFTKNPQEAYEEMLAQRAKEEKTSSATPDYLEHAMLAEKKLEAEKLLKRSVASEKVEEEKPTQVEKKQVVVSVKFSHANSFMEDERSLKKSDKEKLLSKDGELHRFRIWRILNFLESVEKEEQIKRITYLGGRKVLAGEHFYSINDKGQEVIINNLPQYKSSAEANYYVHSYEVEPFGKISVLQAGEGPTLLRAYIINEEAKEVCYTIQASTQKCNLAMTAYLAVSADKAIKDEENLKFTRVAVNKLSDTIPMFTKLSWRFTRPGFFRSLNLVKDEIDSESGRPAKFFTYEFSVCANKLKFVSPARKDYYNNPAFYTSYGGKLAETPEGVNCKRFSMEDLNNLDFESIDSKDNSNFKRIMSEMLK